MARLVTYVFGEFSLDQRLFELRRQGTRVPIEPKVLDVLGFLLVHRDRIVSGAELLEQLWPGEYVTTAALSRCIMEARRAVGDDGTEQRVIKTVHGRGYRFVADVDEQKDEPPPLPPMTKVAVADATPPDAPRDSRRVPIGVAAAAGLMAVVAAAVALGLWLSRGRDLADPMRPHDRDAYRLYLQATDRVVAQAACDAGALELTRESLGIDPAYAPAWVLLGWTHYNQVSQCGTGGTHYQDALAAADRAHALVAAFPAALLLKAVVLVETGRVEDAYDLLSRMPPPASGDPPEIQFGRIYALTYAGQLGEAERRLGRLLATHPRYLGESGWTPNVFLHRARFSEFIAHLPDRQTPIFRFYRGFAELQRGHPTDALRIVEPAFRDNPNDVFGRLSASLRAILEHQPDEARVLVRQVARQRAEVGAIDGEVTYKQAQLLMLAGDRTGALDELARSVAQGFVCETCFDADPVFAEVRPLDAYRQIAASAAVRSRAFGVRFGITESSENHDAILKRVPSGAATMGVPGPRASLAARFRSPD